MATLIENVNAVRAAFSDIKAAIAGKGVEVADGMPVTGYASLIASISGGGTIDNSKNYSYMFAFNNRLDILQNVPINTSKVTDFSHFAEQSTKLSSTVTIDMSSAETAESMFYNCRSLVSTDIQNTGNITNGRNMFYNCSNLLSLEYIDTSSLTQSQSMFEACTMLSKLPEQFDLTSITGSTDSMFRYTGNNTELGSITISFPENISTSNMFQCSGFTEIHINSNTYFISANRLFNGSKNLRTISGLNLSKNTGGRADMFTGCSALENINFVETISNYNLDLSGCTLLSHDSLLNILNALVDNGTSTLAIGNTNIEKLTEEEKSIATNKGWTLA